MHPSLHQGKSEAETEVGIGGQEGVGNKRIIHRVIGINLKVEPVAQHIVGRGANGENPLPCHRLVHLLNQLAGLGFYCP